MGPLSRTLQKLAFSAIVTGLAGCGLSQPAPHQTGTAAPTPKVPVSVDALTCGAGRQSGEAGVVVRDARLTIADRPVDGIKQTYLRAEGCLRVVASDGQDHLEGGLVTAMFFDREGHQIGSASQHLLPFHTVIAISGETPQAISNTRDGLIAVNPDTFLGHPILHYNVVPQVLFQVGTWPCASDSACEPGQTTTNFALLNACTSDDGRGGQPIGNCHDLLPPSSSPPGRSAAVHRSAAPVHAAAPTHPAAPAPAKPAAPRKARPQPAA